MSAAEHEDIHTLLMNHADIRRQVENLSDGVRTLTTTDNPELVEPLRAHVRAMRLHLREQRPVRLWDPLFRDLFNHAADVETSVEEVPGGIQVTNRSSEPEVADLLQAHARKVTSFVEQGPVAARPPWAGGRSRGRND